jgi:hypothetical protein
MEARRLFTQPSVQATGFFRINTPTPTVCSRRYACGVWGALEGGVPAMKKRGDLVLRSHNDAVRFIFV